MENRQVAILGGGHNGLVTAAYLARAGVDVVVLEARDVLGGAVGSARVFDGVDARLSRFSYLVSLLPDRIVDDLGLELELRSRRVASYTPVDGGGLLVERPEGGATRASFRTVTGDDAEYERWRAFSERLTRLAAAVAPSLTEPLPRATEVRERVADEDLWAALTERPVADLIERTFRSDVVRGMVMTDALIGMRGSPLSEPLAENRCFLYHVVGRGTGEWRVPVGGMGAVASALERAAHDAGAELRTGARITRFTPLRDGGAVVTLADGSRVRAPYALSNLAPTTLAHLAGRSAVGPYGNQLKVNLVLRRLPRLASGIDPAVAFAGTLHLGQGFRRLAEIDFGHILDPMPCEAYCHTLTDDSILSPELRDRGYHTLTLFGLAAPWAPCVVAPDRARRQARDAALRSLQAVLAEPLEDCLATDADGRPCAEVMTPVDLEAELGLPGGHIFHGDLAWPWLADDAPADSPAERWGVATPDAGVLLCGSGAVRGGAVSGLGGHNAAMAVLEELGR